MGQEKQQEHVGKNGSGSQPNQNLPFLSWSKRAAHDVVEGSALQTLIAFHLSIMRP